MVFQPVIVPRASGAWPTLDRRSSSAYDQHLGRRSSSAYRQSFSRNRSFLPEREPLRRTTTLQIEEEKVKGPVPFLNPTRARFTQVQPQIAEDEVLPSPPPTATAPSPGSSEAATAQPPSPPAPTPRPTGFKPPQPTLTYQWTSRNSRKGRHALIITPENFSDPEASAPEPTSTPREILRTIGLMLTTFPLGDISFDVAFLFTFGSAVWILNGFFTLLPLSNPALAFPGMALYGGGITAFIGIFIFEVGGVLLLLEAINEDRADCFG